MQNEMTKVEMRQEMINSYLDDLIEDLMKAKSDFIESFSREYSGASAIEWNSARVVEAEALAKLALIIRNGEQNIGLLKACKTVNDRVEKDLLRNYGGSSTNPYANANSDAERDAKARFYERMSYYIESYEVALAEEQEQEDLQNNVTDVTQYAMRSTYSILMNRLKNMVENEKRAKTKKDQLAFNTAGQAVTASIADLQRLAETLDIDLT